MDISGLGNSLISGAIINYFPSVLKGMLHVFLQRVPMDEAIDWVNQDKTLWSEIPAQHRKTLKEYAPKLDNIDWFNFDWVINVGHSANPSLASMFLGWPEGNEWLHKQIDDIKEKMKE